MAWRRRGQQWVDLWPIWVRCPAWAVWWMGMLCSGLASAAMASDARPDTAASSPDRDLALRWLTRLHEAPQQQNYQGVFVMSAGGRVASARIAHVCEGGQQFERVDVLDGPARQVFREGDRVRTVWSQSKLAVVEHYDGGRHGFPSMVNGAGTRVSEYYAVKVLRTDRVAGHDADVVLLEPKDAWRFGHRLWAERRTGLLLRAEVLDATGDVLEWSAFSEVQVGQRVPRDQVVLAPRALEGYEVRRPHMDASTLAEAGWALKAHIPGFFLARCVKRLARPSATPSVAGEQGGMTQAIFSDGLTHVSVFIEPFNPRVHQREALLSMGANHALMRRVDAWWLTVMGDVPAATLRAFMQGLERRAP